MTFHAETFNTHQRRGREQPQARARARNHLRNVARRKGHTYPCNCSAALQMAKPLSVACFFAIAAYALLAGFLSSINLAAWRTISRDDCKSTAMSASMNASAWFAASGLPNCFLVLMWSRARLRHAAAAPMLQVAMLTAASRSHRGEPRQATAKSSAQQRVQSRAKARRCSPWEITHAAFALCHALRPPSSAFIAILKPSPSLPSLFSAGTRTFSRNTAAVGCVFQPSFFSCAASLTCKMQPVAGWSEDLRFGKQFKRLGVCLRQTLHAPRPHNVIAARKQACALNQPAPQTTVQECH